MICPHEIDTDTATCSDCSPPELPATWPVRTDEIEQFYELAANAGLQTERILSEGDDENVEPLRMFEILDQAIAERDHAVEETQLLAEIRADLAALDLTQNTSMRAAYLSVLVENIRRAGAPSECRGRLIVLAKVIIDWIDEIDSRPTVSS